MGSIFRAMILASAGRLKRRLVLRLAFNAIIAVLVLFALSYLLFALHLWLVEFWGRKHAALAVAGGLLVIAAIFKIADAVLARRVRMESRVIRAAAMPAASETAAAAAGVTPSKLPAIAAGAAVVLGILAAWK